MKTDQCIIRFNSVSLVYDLHYDKTNTLKEYVVNSLLRRKYVDGHENKLHALHRIDLTIEQRERVGIIGLNGSGKSTLLKTVAGLLKPSSGELFIRGTVQPLIEIGAGFNPEFTGRENIYLNGAMLGFTKRQIKEKEEEIVEFTELGDFIDVPVKYYSSGMSLRLAFTIATIIRPEILVLDEMLSAGDMEFIQKAKDRMDQILSAAKILVLVSHDMGLIKSLATRVIVLNKGEIFFDGDAEDAIDFYMTMVSHNLEKKQEVLRRRADERQKRAEQMRLEELKRQEEARGTEVQPPVPEAQDEKKCEIPPQIVILKTALGNASRSAGSDIFPGDNVVFAMEFQTLCDFDQFFVNLVLKNKTNTDIAHFRNDFSGVELPDFKCGRYRVRLPLYNLPFRSDPYKYYFRLVGFRGKEQAIVDSEVSTFVIHGDLKRDKLIRHEWKIDAISV